MTTYKFFKHKNGISSFAAIALENSNESTKGIEWATSIASFEPIYGTAVAAGVHDALCWHTAEGGAPTAFRVIDFTELLVDTKSDAVRCAATMAAWKALGHDENDITFDFENGWKAKLSR